MSLRIVAPLSGWQNDMASLPRWYRDTLVRSVATPG